jgi:hypothetical protein
MLAHSVTQVGAPSSTTKADTGCGGKAEDSEGSQDMEVNVQPQAQSDKRKTRPSSPAEKLEIAQQAILDLRQSGTVIQYFQDPKDGGLVLKLSGIFVCQQCKSWQLWENMIGNLCQQCAGIRQEATNPQ